MDSTYKYWFLIVLIKLMEYYSGTSIQETLHSGDAKFGPEKINICIIFLSVTSVERTPLFKGKRHFF